MRRVLKIIYFVFVIMFFNYLFNNKINNNININAANSTSVEVIFSDDVYLEKEKIRIDFNLINVEDLYEIDIKFIINEKYYVPFNNYFTFSASSIYQESPLINDYKDNILRLKLVKQEDILNGYNSSIKNNICYLDLISNTKIENIYEYINSENLIIKLYDINGDSIPYELNFSEKLQFSWDKEEYKIKVNESFNDIKNDIVIKNRKETEYKLSIDHDINLNKIGEYSILLVIFDAVNNEIIKDSRKVYVVDEESPKITCSVKEFNINDYDLDLLILDNYFNITDNYDKDLDLIFEYYDINNNLLSKNEFFLYLKNNIKAYFIVYSKDSSNNESERKKYKIEINDTVAPIVNYNNNIYIDVSEINSFNIDNYLEITDNYDLTPSYTCCYYDENSLEIFDLEAYFKLNLGFLVKVLVFDDALNYSEEIVINVLISDTISPTLEVNNIELIDFEIDKFNIFNYINYQDNVDTNLSVKLYLYNNSLNNNELIEIINNDFNNKLISYFKNKLTFKYFLEVKDKAGNITQSDYKTINIIDKTKPVIKINNQNGINNGYKITNIKDLNIEISDNYSTNFVIEYFLNNELIEYFELENLIDGEYELKIKVTDEAGNINEIVKNIKIVDKVINNNDLNINLDVFNNLNYYYIIILGIFILSIIILIFRIIKNRKKELKYKN